MEARIIGHYLLTLTEEQEDRVLTSVLRPGGIENGCIIAITGDFQSGKALNWPRDGSCVAQLGSYIGTRYDWLCWRFGTLRINTMLRNRILSNRARRILQNIPVGVGDQRSRGTPQ